MNDAPSTGSGLTTPASKKGEEEKEIWKSERKRKCVCKKKKTIFGQLIQLPTFRKNFEILKEEEKLTQVMTSALGFQLLKSPISVADCSSKNSQNIVIINYKN